MARPVSRDSFSYDGSHLCVRPENTHEDHHRCEARSLYALLTYEAPVGPVLAKKGAVAKRQPHPHRDEPGHFYIAQLALYGLKAYKTKDAVKMHLLAAFKDDHTLPIPPHLLQLERELKEEYEKANNIAVAAHAAEKTAHAAVKATQERNTSEATARQKAVFKVADDDFEKEDIAGDDTETGDVAELLTGLNSAELVQIFMLLVHGTLSLFSGVEAEVELMLWQQQPPLFGARQTVRRSGADAANADVMMQVRPKTFGIPVITNYSRHFVSMIRIWTLLRHQLWASGRSKPRVRPQKARHRRVRPRHQSNQSSA